VSRAIKKVEGDRDYTIGGASCAEKNIICGNYKIGEDPRLDQQIGDRVVGSIYNTFKGTNDILIFCD